MNKISLNKFLTYFIYTIKMIPKKIYSKASGQSQYPFLYQIPPKKGRYLIVDTETTGIYKGNYLTEIGGIEMINGIVSKKILNFKFDSIIIKERILKNKFSETETNFEEVKNKLNLFREWVGDSIVFAHNASFDMGVLNKTLSAFDLEEIPSINFRCSMHIFLEIVGITNPLLNKNYISLKECCNYFALQTNGQKYHTAKTDATMLCKLLLRLYEELDKNSKLKKIFNYNDLDDIKSHYKIYIDLKKRNNRINSYNDKFFKPLNEYAIPPFLKGNSKVTGNALMDDKEAKINKMVKDGQQNEQIEEKNDINLFEGKTSLENKEKKFSSDIVNKIISEYEEYEQLKKEK
jgi:DNA polymerase III epsilon subunit-like protein